MHNRDSRGRRKKGTKNIFEEIMAENFPNLKEMDIKIHKARRETNNLNPNRPIPRHSIIKMTKKKKIKRGF